MPAEVFFPDNWERVPLAKLVCAKCRVKKQCLEAGMNEPYGIWGGKTERERRHLQPEVLSSVRSVSSRGQRR